MSIYLSKIFNVEHIDIDYDDWSNCEPIEGGWNNCKSHSISVSLGMKEMWNTDEGRKLRKKKSLLQRNDKKFAVCGNKGKKHTEETKRKQALSYLKRMTDEQKEEAKKLYNKGIAYKNYCQKHWIFTYHNKTVSEKSIS